LACSKRALDKITLSPVSADRRRFGKCRTGRLVPIGWPNCRRTPEQRGSGNGPGIQEVATFSVDVSGPNGSVAVSNAHGTVTGAAGGVLLRPFARLISKSGDSVTTYAEPWNMN
jgi:hypothetical protein